MIAILVVVIIALILLLRQSYKETDIADRNVQFCMQSAKEWKHKYFSLLKDK